MIVFHRADIEVTTRGRGTLDITERVQLIVKDASIGVGLCTVFVHHTSATRHRGRGPGS